MAEKTLRVENFEQKALLELELCGQISDGYWENAKPFNHWKFWSDLNIIVDPENTGFAFSRPHRAYNFAAYDLLKVVRTRMILYVRLARRFAIKIAGELECLFETVDENCNAMPTIELLQECPEYASEVAKQIYAEQKEMLELLASAPIKSSTTDREEFYNLKMLNKDLEALNRIVNH